jgi:hypothetical protein
MKLDCRKAKRTGHWHFLFSWGPLFLSFIPHLRPRLLAYWNKHCFIGRDFDQLRPSKPTELTVAPTGTVSQAEVDRLAARVSAIEEGRVYR